MVDPLGIHSSPAQSQDSRSHHPMPDSVTVTYKVDIASFAILKIVLTGVALWLVVQVGPIIGLVSIALMLMATFDPWVARLESKLSRTGSIAVVVALWAVVGAALLTLWLPILVEQIQALVGKAPQLTRMAQETLSKYNLHLNLETQVGEYSSLILSEVPQVLKNASTLLLGFVAVVILTIYLLLEGPALENSLLLLLPMSQRPVVSRLGSEIYQQVGGYTRGLLVTSVLAGLSTFTILKLCGVPEPFALAALTAVSDAVPVVGLLLALVPCTLMALTISPTTALVVAVAYLVYHQIEINLIAPRVFGHILGMPLSIVVICFMLGGQLLGILGAALALPVAAAVPTLLVFLREWQAAASTKEIESKTAQSRTGDGLSRNAGVAAAVAPLSSNPAERQPTLVETHSPDPEHP